MNRPMSNREVLEAACEILSHNAYTPDELSARLEKDLTP